MAFTIMDPKVKHLRMLNTLRNINILCFLLHALLILLHNINQQMQLF